MVYAGRNVTWMNQAPLLLLPFHMECSTHGIRKRHGLWKRRIHGGWSGEHFYEWTVDNDPCPSGWRVPTIEEFQKLLDRSKSPGLTLISSLPKSNQRDLDSLGDGNLRTITQEIAFL